MCTSEKIIWLNTSQVARKLNVSNVHVRNLINAGKFDMVRDVGSRKQSYYQIAKQSVEKFMVESMTLK
jgi:hypothetical protein